MTTPSHEPRAQDRRALVRNSLSSGSGMAVSMLAGLLLDGVIALRYGAGSVADAFFVGARIPLGINTLLLAGSTQALTPLLATAATRRDWSVVTRVLVALGGASTLVWVFGAAVARPLTLVTAPGLDDAATSAAVDVTRIMFGMVPLVLAAEVLRAVLNVQRRFGLAALMGFVLNALAALAVVAAGRATATNLAWAYMLGAAGQLLYVAALAWRAGLRPTLSGWGDGQAAAVARLSVRPAAAAAVNLGNRLIEQFALSFLAPGSITIASYANLLVSSIGGLFFRSTTVVVLPDMARAAAEHDHRRVRQLAQDTFRLMIAVALPLTAFTTALAVPAVLVVFRRGEFSYLDARFAGLMLMVYALSLVGSAAQRSILTVWLARLDTRMQLSSAVVGMASELVLLVALLSFTRSGQLAGLLSVAAAWMLSQYVISAYCYRRSAEDHRAAYRSAVTSLRGWGLLTGLASATMAMAYQALHASEGTRVTVLGKGAIVAALGLGVMALGAGAALRSANLSPATLLARSGRRS